MFSCMFKKFPNSYSCHYLQILQTSNRVVATDTTVSFNDSSQIMIVPISNCGAYLTTWDSLYLLLLLFTARYTTRRNISVQNIENMHAFEKALKCRYLL